MHFFELKYAENDDSLICNKNFDYDVDFFSTFRWE